MSLFAHPQRAKSLAAVLAASLGFCLSARAGGHGEKIEFSDPSTPVTISSNAPDTANTGLSRLNPTPNALKQVQEDLFRPLANSMKNANGDSMQGVTSLPQSPANGPAVLTRHQREANDRRKNWVFSTLNDLDGDPTADSALGADGTSEGHKGDFVPIMQKYYDSLGQTATNRLQEKNPYDFSSNPYSPTNWGGQKLGRPFEPQQNEAAKALFGSRDPDANFQDVSPGFGRKHSGFGKDSTQVSESERRSAEFRQMIEGTPGNSLLKPVPTGLDGVLTGPQTPGTAANALNPLQPSFNLPRLNPAGVQLTPPDPTLASLHDPSLIDPTARSMGLPNPKPAPPPTPQETPDQVSRRILDPFGSVVAKPKF